MKEAIDAAGQEANIFVGYLGTGDATVSAPFAGTIVAPHATLKMDPAPKGYRGSFFAESIEIGPRAIVKLEPFAAWDFIFPPKPIVDCNAYFDSTHSNALWGYENPLDVSVTIPVGARNHFTPPEGQPITTFEPGRHTAVFWAAFSGTSLGWFLGGATVLVDGSTRRCGFSDVPPSATPSPLDQRGEGSSAPRASLLSVLIPVDFNGVTLGPLAPPQRPAPFPEREFKFVIDDQTFGSDAICGPRRLFAKDIFVNGVAFPQRTFPGCTNPDACAVPPVHEEFVVSVPSNQPTVPVRLNIFEEDTGPCGGDSQLVLGLDVTVDNANGRISGGINTPSGGARFLEPGERCATGTDGFGICWHALPSGKPRLCSAWNAQFIDSGPNAGFAGVEDFAAGGPDQLQQVPASFARAGYIFTSGGSTFTWIGTLDERGCVPADVVPPGALWRTGTGSPLTVSFALSTEHCFDLTNSDCGPNPADGKPRGARFSTRRKEDAGPSLLCTAWTENSTLDVPGCHKIVNAFPGWQAGSPPSEIRLVDHRHSETTSLSAVVSQLLSVEKAGPSIGIKDALVDGVNGVRVNDGLVQIVAKDVCCFKTDDNGAPNCAPVPECLRNGDCDTCAGSDVQGGGGTPVLIRPDDTPPGESLVPGDSFWKYTIAHEIGHVIQRRAVGRWAIDYDLPPNAGTFRAERKCACDHVRNANTTHCLQSIEEPGFVQQEGYAQFFASRVWNRASDSDCTFKYYKDFLNNTCMPGVPSDGCQNVDGLVRSLPPIPIDCVTPVRWRNNQCFDNTVTPGQAVTDLGIEYDWMGFFYRVNTQDPSTSTSMTDLFQIYRVACGGNRCTGLETIAFEACRKCLNPREPATCTPCDGGVSGLRDAASRYYDTLGQPARFARFAADGDQYGVSRGTQR